MATIKVDFANKIAAIKPMHGVGQPPFSGADFSMIHYLKEAGIPFSRLHDVGGAYGGHVYVDIPNLFRDFSADPDDPEAYDFAFTDLLITELVKNEVEPFFRLGVTIENNHHIRAYHIYPPKDSLKWARICAGIIRHYTEGWANGYNYNIRYWEIWNEPDNEPEIEKNPMWRGTKEEYFDLYKVASIYLKKQFPHLKIGGFGSCGFYAIGDGGTVSTANSSQRTEYFIDFFESFLTYVRDHRCPLDFFSWHSYAGIERNILFAKYARSRLDEFGFTSTETTCNEWNPEVSARGTAHHAALVAAGMLAFQNTPLDSAMFYDARFDVSIYGSLFNPLTAKPFPAYYSFVAYNELYRRKDQAALVCNDACIYAVAAKDKDGCMIIANPTTKTVPIDICTDLSISSCKLLDEENMLSDAGFAGRIPSNSVILLTFE